MEIYVKIFYVTKRYKGELYIYLSDLRKEVPMSNRKKSVVLGIVCSLSILAGYLEGFTSDKVNDKPYTKAMQTGCLFNEELLEPEVSIEENDNTLLMASYNEAKRKADLKKKAEKEAKRKEKERKERLKIEAESQRDYSLTDEEYNLLCKLAFAEAMNQGKMGMVYVINCAINSAIYNKRTIRQEINARGRYATVKNGVIVTGSGRTVTNNDITDEVRDAVSMAAKKDYTYERLKEVADELGLDETYYKGGARYFYAPASTCQSELNRRSRIQVCFREKDVVFFANWN